MHTEERSCEDVAISKPRKYALEENKSVDPFLGL